ncbi:hypothetical protein VB773_12055 [Haloarculaceae archaeon H-GB2-1]|nr:hypothetical protein [Haloarculaceae archaeon H-GB1-1]MEA5408219.1 hypothetical protein [Haloarculaceae archaeon H-GB2-1]
MTTVAVLADPPHSGFVLDDLAAASPLTDDEAATLYTAMLADVCQAIESSGADLLVNYRPDDQVPDGVDSEAVVRDSLTGVLADPNSVRFEVQVGSTRSARIGNTVTHLLEREGVKTAAVVDPTAAFLARTNVDSAAMKLRSSEVVLGPAPEGRVYYAGFGAPIDFEDAYTAPELTTLTERAADADHDVDFLPMQPVLDSAADLPTAITTLRAHERAGRAVPQRTAACIEEFGLSVVDTENGLDVV